jgi:hypothetical protein
MAALSENGSIAIDDVLFLTWSAAWRSKSVGAPCGDRHLVRQVGGVIMLAAMDGSGSGEMAAQAAASCHAALSALDSPFPIETCFAAAHDACRDTNGAALCVALIEAGAERLTWAAVGDIDGLLVRPAGPAPSECILQCGGTIGANLPMVLSQTHRLAKGDTVVLVSDGIRRIHRGLSLQRLTAAAMAERILSDYGRADDDAIVLAARMEPPS